ncbi:MAG: DUF1919 domain-containing protein [Candidatus Methanomethylophilaceae archaeon]|nr:DUF1919 domain-containing protein [Candidatus Methanomethylophilaceae archaeon]
MSGKSPSDGAELPTNHVRPRCILLDGHDFDPYFNHVLLQHVRGEIEIAGILTVHREIGTILGFEALHSEDIGKETFDYIIVMDVEGFLELRRRLVSCFQVEPDKIVSCSPFSEPGFSFATYSSKARHPTLVAANCFGGLAYNFEGWRFDSPFVNMLVSIPGMLKLIEDFEGYIDRELKLVRMVGSGKGRYPLVMLGDVSIRMMHYHSFEDALAKWEERKARMNRDEVVFFLYWRGSKDLFVKNPSGRRVYVLTNRPD